MRMFRSRTLSGSNVAGLLMGAAVFSQFFLLTLYMQQVLHYSALQTGVAYVALTLAVIVFANVFAGARPEGRNPAAADGRTAAARERRLRPFAHLPVEGHYFCDLFPAFLISGIGMAFGFIPMTIGALAGVPSFRRRGRLRAHQHRAADRRGDRRGRRHDGGGDLHQPLRGRASGRRPGEWPRADPRLPGVAFYVLAAVAAAGAIACGAAGRVQARARGDGHPRR